MKKFEEKKEMILNHPNASSDAHKKKHWNEEELEGVVTSFFSCVIVSPHLSMVVVDLCVSGVT